MSEHPKHYFTFQDKNEYRITNGRCSSIGFETFVHQFVEETTSGQNITSAITINANIVPMGRSNIGKKILEIIFKVLE